MDDRSAFSQVQACMTLSYSLIVQWEVQSNDWSNVYKSNEILRLYHSRSWTKIPLFCRSLDNSLILKPNNQLFIYYIYFYCFI